MTIQVKICGLTNLDDARAAAEAGADLLGFIFYPHSPRYVAPETVTEISLALRAEFGAKTPKLVGVFVDAPVDEVSAVLTSARLDLAQLHGSEPPAELRILQPRAFKAMRPQTRGDAEAISATYYDVVPQEEDLPQFLLDAYDPWRFGGTGTMADWSVAKLLAGRFRLILAGGLTPDRVAEAVQRVRPWGVDVASGVEREKGLKDQARVTDFVRRAKEAAAHGE